MRSIKKGLMPSTGDKNRSNDETESLSSAEIIRQHLKKI